MVQKLLWRLRSANASTRRLLLIPLAGILILVCYAVPAGVDWQKTYNGILRYRDPYLVSTFTNPPWATILLPHSLLPLQWGNAVNLALNIIVMTWLIQRLGGKPWTLALVFTSPIAIQMARTNNIEWIPALAICLGPALGFPLMALKPHALGGACIVWAWRVIREKRFATFIPLLVVVASSFVIWGLWPQRLNGLPPDSYQWNFSPWPWGIPLGLVILGIALRRDDPLLAALATPLLTPYIASYSLVAPLAIIATRWPQAGIAVWGALWWHVVVFSMRLGP